MPTLRRSRNLATSERPLPLFLPPKSPIRGDTEQCGQDQRPCTSDTKRDVVIRVGKVWERLPSFGTTMTAFRGVTVLGLSRGHASTG